MCMCSALECTRNSVNSWNKNLAIWVDLSYPWVCLAAPPARKHLTLLRKRTEHKKQTIATGEKCTIVVPLVFEHFDSGVRRHTKESPASEVAKSVADFLTR